MYRSNSASAPLMRCTHTRPSSRRNAPRRSSCRTRSNTYGSRSPSRRCIQNENSSHFACTSSVILLGPRSPLSQSSKIPSGRSPDVGRVSDHQGPSTRVQGPSRTTGHQIHIQSRRGGETQGKIQGIRGAPTAVERKRHVSRGRAGDTPPSAIAWLEMVRC